MNAGCSIMDEQRVLIVNYHYCVAEDENPYLARTAVSPIHFAQQVAQLARLICTLRGPFLVAPSAALGRLSICITVA